MASRKSIAGFAFAAILVIAATVYIFATPYNRIAGVRIGGTLTPPPADFTTAFPRISEILAMKATWARGLLVGLFVGVVPGAGATVSSFVAYGLESQYGKKGKELGKGAPEGIVVSKAAGSSP